MNAIKVIGYVAAAILVFFGIMFIWASFGELFNAAWFIIGLVSVAIGFGVFWFASRQKPAEAGPQNVTVNVDLPGNVGMDTLKCKACGGVLSPKDITMVAGAPVVTCPYCGTTYQLTEEPKW